MDPKIGGLAGFPIWWVQKVAEIFFSFCDPHGQRTQDREGYTLTPSVFKTDFVYENFGRGEVFGPAETPKYPQKPLFWAVLGA